MTEPNKNGVEPAPPVAVKDVVNPRAWGNTFTSLKEPEYAWYFVGNIAFFMGMQMQFVLRGFLGYELTGSAVALAWISIAIALPMLVGAPFGGLVADRVDKRWLLMITQTISAAASIIVAVLIITDQITFFQLVAMSFITGIVFSFNMPARQALVPNLVPQHKLMNAVSLQMGGMNLTRILAPALGGLLIAPFGVGWVYMLTAALFVVAVASELHLPKHGMKSLHARKPFLEDFTVGFRYIGKDPTLRLLMIAALIMPLFGFPVQQLFPVFAADVYSGWGGESIRLGLLASAAGVGGLAGALIAANMDDQPAKGKLMFIGGAIMGICMLLFALSPFFAIALIFLVAMGIGQMVFQATNNATIQANLPNEVRGRVMSVLMMSFGLMPLGVVPVSFAADEAGAPWAIGASAVVFAVVLVGMWIFSPKLRNLWIESNKDTTISAVRAAEMVAAGKITQEEADNMTGETARREAARARQTASPRASSPGGR